MENPEKPQTVKSAELAQTIWHVAGITVLLNMTDEEITDTFHQVSLHTLADWKQQPEWKEASAAFAKVGLDPRTKKFLKKGPFARRIMLNTIRYTPPIELIRPGTTPPRSGLCTPARLAERSRCTG